MTKGVLVFHCFKQLSFASAKFGPQVTFSLQSANKLSATPTPTREFCPVPMLFCALQFLIEVLQYSIFEALRNQRAPTSGLVPNKGLGPLEPGT